MTKDQAKEFKKYIFEKYRDSLIEWDECDWIVRLAFKIDDPQWAAYAKGRVSGKGNKHPL